MRYLGLLAALGLLLASGLLLAIYGPAPYAAAARLRQVAYYEYAPGGASHLALALSPGRYAALRAGLGLGLGGSLLALGWGLRRRAARWSLRRLGQEVGWAGGALGRVVRAWSGRQRLVAAGLLLGLLAVRVGWLVLDSLSPDEITSYDTFVHQGAVAVTSFYPIPNNHVGANLLAWVAAQLMPGQVRLLMRLPTLLVATAGTALSYALLARVSSFRVATYTTALFGLVPASVLYATAGRGYYGQLVCLQVGFFAALELVGGGRCRRLAWLALGAGSVAGLYAVPTYASPLAVLLLGLGAASAGWPPRRRRRFWGQLLAAGLGIGAVTAVLYAPLGAVSGWPRLLANRYLTPQLLASYVGRLLAYAYETAAHLLGPVRPALVLSAALVALAPLGLRRGCPAAGPARWLGWGAWALVVGPLGLMLAQRVFVPPRALWYTTYFLYLLAALGAAGAVARWRGRWPARVATGLVGALLLWRVSELAAALPELRRSQAAERAAARAYCWLRAQPPGAVLLRAPYQEIMLYHHALLAGRPLRLAVEHPAEPAAAPGPGPRPYRYLVWARGQGPLPAWAAGGYRLAYHDEWTRIYARQSAGTF